MYRKPTLSINVGDSEIEKMIELVRLNPVLYDLGHKDYLNSAMKANTWRSIAEAIGVIEVDGTSVYYYSNTPIVIVFQ